MIIVSQDKKAIVNFDNVNEIRVSTNQIIMFDNTYQSSDNCSDILGTYKTEERAKEVLQEVIQNIYPKSNVDMDIDGISFGVQSPVYEMPLE